MISRIIEAKPEGRCAAFEWRRGVTKYRSGASETGRALPSDAHNLTRLDYIRNELGQQIGVEAQAAAEKYRQLNASLRPSAESAVAAQCYEARAEKARLSGNWPTPRRIEADSSRLQELEAQPGGGARILQLEANGVQFPLPSRFCLRSARADLKGSWPHCGTAGASSKVVWPSWSGMTPNGAPA